jgi:hypothetical protein
MDEDRIVPLDVGHPDPDVSDDPGCLMPHHYRCLAGPVASNIGDIAMAHGAGGHLNSHLAGARRIQPQVFNNQGLTEFMTNCGFHQQRKLEMPIYLSPLKGAAKLGKSG